MGNDKKGPVGRRGFLKDAAVTAAAFVAEPSAAHGHAHHDHGHDHQHQAVPSDVALRVKALESLLVEKGLVDRAALDAVVDSYENEDRSAQRRARRRAGLGRSGIQEAAVDRRRPPRSRSSAIRRLRARTWWSLENTAENPQPRRLHAVLVLSVADPRPSAASGTSRQPYRSRAVIDPRGVLARVRPRHARRRRGARLGQHRRDPLHRAARAARRAPNV